MDAGHPGERLRRLILEGEPARQALVRGVDRMTALLRPTLGPLARTVAIAPLVGSRPPEVLDSAATIARRTLQLADPFEDMGAMIVRHAVWRVFDRVGDGSATTAVLIQAILHQGARYIAAGGQPVAVRRGLERGLEIALAELRRQVRRIDGPEAIAASVGGAIGDQRLADMVGEVVDSVGPDGAILIEDAQGIETAHEYLDGVRWNEGYVSPFLLRADESVSANVLNPRILITDFALDRAEQLVPALEACVASQARSLFVVAPEVRDAAIGVLMLNRERGVLDAAVAVRAPSFGAQRSGILEDLAVITGGRYISRDRGDRLEDVGAADLGQARQAWATQYAFCILGGRGTREALRQRIGDARAELRNFDGDAYERDKIKERIGKLGGTAAVIRVGAPTPGEQADLKLRIEAAVRSARAALESGVVPGGGAALLHCASMLGSVSCPEAEAVGVRALQHALAEPMRAILRNSGWEPELLLSQANAEYPRVFDVQTGAWSEDIVDALAVVEAALETSVSAAAAALTAEVLVRRPKAAAAVNP